MYKSYPKTQFIGQKIIYLPSCHSTNDLAAESLRNDAPEGTLYVTDEQTAGRGQRGNVWRTNTGENLTFSFIVHPTFLRATEQFRLSIAIALGIHDFLTELLYDGVKLKWPNDLYYKDQKLGGVLIENSLMGTHLTGSVIGIGLNINQLSFSITTATSVRQITGKEYSLEALLLQLCNRLEERYLALKDGSYNQQKIEYLQRLYRFREWHRFQDTSGKTFNGQIIGVAEFGQLQVETETDVRLFDIKEISFVQ
ncbi:biotin--[acetyl-CoA-carboxylase] ligase [Siphonobacter sp. SORGH_AS_1065]|uniref:biotin--[acetyl-CoA-carboxylase] ligase n=1 Tax=Siphonobacter sp. SORGH_AS_1065 TaxID=3041795 RepID=UPI00278974B8|nr:biotin--[acetyl-CoA-carboxylase] ligase [Siphonobacter sp. SORGH_AS_1065]MDQ1088173.1 BirA family biotin operon repressor/biotin-[acetyl-CoA-carboxylase] ligase [Siphonobacter sp. SORGH_AS_1065]